ncbi:VOC family protein [Halobellus salinisoli]|uniref:VOC family protein n=1 Tax=Halobellus salinisoli TaxID=3108500 RepID=UPI00300B01DE
MTERVRLDGIRLDHVLYAGRDLDRLEAIFESVELPPDYGGVHGNRVTHNAVVGFDDGSYAELLALYDAERESPRRNAYLRSNVGPCGWALETADAEEAADRFRGRGVTVEGPVSLGRERPDGTRTEWNLVYLGTGEPGAALPFLIEDVTPRSTRIQPTEGITGTELTGIDRVIVGSADPSGAISTFRRAFALPEPVRERSEALEATVAVFPETPLVIATAETGWLSERTRRFGDLVCAFLIGTTDFDASVDRCGIAETEVWRDQRVGWFPVADDIGGRFGIVEVDG